jgi:signal transduction histidine kinase
MTYGPGEGLPGRVVETRRPECVADLRRNRGFPARAEHALELGLRSAFAVPILVNEEVHSVLEFVSIESISMDDRLTELFTHIGAQLGRVAERGLLEERVRQSRKMEAIGQLAAGLAHEINNPMSYVRSNLHALRESWQALRAKGELFDDADGSRERFEDSGEMIDESLDGVERTIAIVRDVNELSHAGGGRPEDWSLAPLADVLAGAIRVASSQAPPGVHIESDCADAPEVRCSPNQLGQVFVNLIVNAVQAVGEGGHIGISVESGEAEIIVRVADDGPGIPPEVRERLFDPFFTTKGVGKGTGLGLYVSHEIVRHHGGEVGVHAEHGGGTTFEVRLPRVTQTP